MKITTTLMQMPETEIGVPGAIQKTVMGEVTIRESWLKLYIKPAPNWMPRGLYVWLMSNIIIQEQIKIP